MTTINLALTNGDLYKGLAIETVAGRLNLTTPVAEAIHVLGRNIEALVASIPAEDRDTVTLTGPMAVWSYLIVFHAVVHKFKAVYYDDGRTGPVLVAKHG